MKLLERNVDAFVKQIAHRAGRLVGKIAVSGTRRRPIAWTEDAFFLGIIEALESEKIPRSVAADMFGVSVRTLQRRLDATRRPEGKQSDLIDISHYIREHGPISREALMMEFPSIAPHRMASFVRDLVTAGAFTEVKKKVSYAGGETELTDEELNEMIVRMHHYFEMHAPEIAAITDVDLAMVEAILCKPVEPFDADENTVWILMPEALKRAFSFFEGRVAGETENHKGVVLNIRCDHLPPEGRQELRDTVQKCVADLRDVAGKFGDVNRIYPSEIVKEWSVVLLENFDTELDHRD